MAEYVVKGAEPNETVLHTRTPNGYEAWNWLPVRERIVRCRDCKHFVTNIHGSYCKKSISTTSDPDGFCAWGERRESE